MNKIKFWDEYEIKARYIPIFLSVAPLVHFLILFLGEAFWKELIGNIGWMLIVADLSLSLIVMLALVQVQCGFAKHWVEESVFGMGGERFPTTDMLLYNGGLISFERKEQIRNRITEQFSVKLSSRDEEKNNPDNARLQAREAVGHVRSTVGKGAMTFQYNIRYGFFRNLIGGVIWGAVGSIGCSVIYGINNNWKIMSLFIGNHSDPSPQPSPQKGEGVEMVSATSLSLVTRGGGVNGYLHCLFRNLPNICSCFIIN